jgi:hypothetical protein
LDLYDLTLDDLERLSEAGKQVRIEQIEVRTLFKCKFRIKILKTETKS